MRPNYLLGLASIAVLALTGPGLQAQSTSGFVLGEKSLQLTIPDLDPSGVARSQTVSGLAEGLIYDLTVRLVVEGTGFGAFNGDYYAYLRHETPDGSQSELVVLLNRVGRGAGLPSGYSESGFNVTFSDAATWDIHRYQVALGGATDGPLTGTWQPDGRRVNPLVSLDTSARTTSLEPLGTMNPNGSWALFIADVEAGGTGRLMEWELRGTPRGIIPEPRAVTLFVAGAGLLGWLLRNRRNPVR
jgi:hypothetical protein